MKLSLSQLTQWHETNQHKKIADAISAMPSEEMNFEYMNHLTRAYTNLDLYHEAYALLSEYATEGKSTSIWNWRMGLCLYETDRKIDAIPYLEKAIQLGDNTPETVQYLKLARQYQLTQKEALPFVKKAFQDNQSFLQGVAVQNVPWNRLATTYGRATDFPLYFEALLASNKSEVDAAGEELERNIEHQSTLWPATPFAMIFLARILEKVMQTIEQYISRYVVMNLLDLFVRVAEGCMMADEREQAAPLPRFEDMLGETYLWPEEYDEDDDVARYEEDGGPFPDNLFYSFYYYSYMVLKTFKSEFQEYMSCSDAEIACKMTQLISMIN